jgi:hypothetical protein
MYLQSTIVDYVHYSGKITLLLVVCQVFLLISYERAKLSLLEAFLVSLTKKYFDR